MITWLRALFAWRDVYDSGVWLYRENRETGARYVMRSNGAGWQPVDQLWLDGIGDHPCIYVPPNEAAKAWANQ